jgi:hypothetical protein
MRFNELKNIVLEKMENIPCDKLKDIGLKRLSIRRGFSSFNKARESDDLS